MIFKIPPDLEGYVCKYNIANTDGTIINKGAFANHTGRRVSIMEMHNHKSVIYGTFGHVVLEDHEDGLYGYFFYNDLPESQRLKHLAQRGEANSISIYATDLNTVGKRIMSGRIWEVSHVFIPGNPGAQLSKGIIFWPVELEIIEKEDAE